MRKLTTLDNGLRIVTHTMPAFESVTFGVWNNVGSRDEHEEINGTAHFWNIWHLKAPKQNLLERLLKKLIVLAVS